MLLAAGLGRRMRPLTETLPKPLLTLQRRSLLDRALDRLAEAGVDEVVVNAHWHAEQIATRLAAREAREPGHPRVVLRREASLLDTGGAVRAALAEGLLPSDAPFFIVNADSVWLDGPRPAPRRLADAFAPDREDALMLLTRGAFVTGSASPSGDFALDPLGLPRRPKEREIVPYLYAGLQIATAALLDDMPAGPFSLNLAWDRALAAGRLRGLVHDSLWFHFTRPLDLPDAEKALRDAANLVPTT